MIEKSIRDIGNRKPGITFGRYLEIKALLAIIAEQLAPVHTEIEAAYNRNGENAGKVITGLSAARRNLYKSAAYLERVAATQFHDELIGGTDGSKQPGSGNQGSGQKRQGKRRV